MTVRQRATAGRNARGAGGASLLPTDADVVGGVRWRRALRRRVLHWYSSHARQLPWRQTRDPYAIWISETMLQQTQVATVVPYYERFLQAFPTVRCLAAADEQNVLRLWEGLGYYRRARQLHRAARTIVSDYDARFPEKFDQILQLPGIGRYTAGAVLSFAFDRRHPIVEANTLRLYSRLLAFRGDPRGSAGQKLLWQAAAQWLPRRQVGTFNQAMMELGSRVCTVRNPICVRCPVADLCPTRKLGLQAKIPRPPAAARIENVRQALVAVFHQGRALLIERGEDQRWAGMWDFLRLNLTRTVRTANIARQIVRETGLSVHKLRRRATLKHSVTRFRITLYCYEGAITTEGKTSVVLKSAKSARWLKPEELSDYALNVTARKFADLLERRGRG